MDRKARERWSPVARWSLRIAVVGGVVTAYGILLHRYGYIETPATFTLVCFGLSAAVLALGLSIYAMATTWVEVVRGFRYGALGAIVSLLILAPPAYFVVPGLALPAIHDISTDLADPPRFIGGSFGRPAWASDLKHPGQGSALAESQRVAYPDIAPLFLDVHPEEAFAFAQRAALDLNWEVTATLSPPTLDAEGQVEAVARTMIVGYADDVVVRVRRELGRARFDVRSVSRFGRSDLGRNAARIRETLARIELYSEE